MTQRRIAWRNVATGDLEYTQWMAPGAPGLLERDVADLNERCPEITHWIEEREAPARNDEREVNDGN